MGEGPRTVEEIERQAERVLADVPSWLWDGDSLPVPIEDIADSCFNLLVRDVEDLTRAPGCPPLEPGQTLSGLLLSGEGEIWVNADEARQWPPRRRFTIGHELGHWVMHRSGRESLFCRSKTVQPDEQSEADRVAAPDIEDEASVFAAALVMPARLVRHHYDNTTREFERLCAIFATSGAAMGRRLHAVI